MATIEKDLSLEGLRGFASLIVAIGHFLFIFMPYLASPFYSLPGAVPTFWIERLLTIPPFTLLFSADAAVNVFFVMSGYVLTTRLVGTESLVDFRRAAAKRYIRLVLPTAVSIVFAWLLWKWGFIITKQAGELGVAGWVPSWYRIQYSPIEAIFNAFIGAPIFAQTALNPPVWTIQIELIGSLFLFAMISLFTSRSIQLLLWSFFFANILSANTLGSLYYLSFLGGALLNHASEYLKREQIISSFLIILGLVLLAYNSSPVFDMLRWFKLPNLTPFGPDYSTTPRILWHSAGALALVAGVLGSSAARQALSRPLPVYLGKISFSLYLIHMPIIMSVGLWTLKACLLLHIPRGWAIFLTMTVYLAVAMAAATAFQRWVDAPAIRFAAKIGIGNRSRGPTSAG